MRILSLKVLLVLLAVSPSFSFTQNACPQDIAGDVSFMAQDLQTLAKNILASCELVEEGKLLYKKLDYFKASEKFKEALSRDPGNKNAQKYLDLCEKKLQTSSKSGETIAATRREKGLEILKDLDQRIQKLEGTAPERNVSTYPIKKTSPIKPAVKKEKGPVSGKTETQISQKTSETEKELSPSKSDEKEKIKKAEYLIEQGDKYYQQGKFIRAYELYKEALELL